MTVYTMDGRKHRESADKGKGCSSCRKKSPWMGGKIGNPQIRGKVAARSLVLPPSMLGFPSLVLPPSKLEVMSRGRSVAAVHGVESQLSLSHFSFPDFSSHLW